MRGLAGKLAFRPEALPRSLLTGIALIPPVLAGLVIFGLPAAYMLGVAVAAGLVTQGAARIAHVQLQSSPVVTAVIGVGLMGPQASLWWAAVIAASACLLEVGRSLLPGRPLPFHSGLWGYAAVFLAGHGQIAAYLAPGRSLRPFPEPIRLWHDFFGGAAAPLDPVTLYIGNVAGPTFATSLLGVALGAAWLWYTKRLDLAALVGVAAGAVAASVLLGWNVGYQVISGPLWFAAAYCFADRRLLVGPPILGTVLGAAAGLAAVSARSRGFGIEAAAVSFAAAQLAVTIVVGLAAAVHAGLRRRAPEMAAGDKKPASLRRPEPSSAGSQLK